MVEAEGPDVREGHTWLNDVTHEKLQSIANNFDIEHLSPAKSDARPSYPPRGTLCGAQDRLVVPRVCRYDSKTAISLNVLFVVNTGVWGSYLSEKTMLKALKGDFEPGSHVLGMGALRQLGWSPMISWKHESFVLDKADLFSLHT
ncbi:unnamed protein product [Vitrella brassicaformis CCMP3155]|uniref:Uncharacterized protein n=1 Tax=Vitrella brassicaformis (strain CCMP3155) TaxID=1169540 RepID=A0A0G4FYH7_VITBC|nr:unnamed protein product [Vitrella brassicaformis CCMP3155]|eukprot:CEM20410.1 unnamed protein product [Vitrella brassicaformis CCMP3155]